MQINKTSSLSNDSRTVAHHKDGNKQWCLRAATCFFWLSILQEDNYSVYAHRQTDTRTKQTPCKYRNIDRNLILLNSFTNEYLINHYHRIFRQHIDCKIDGEVVDIKTASNYAYKKFSEQTLRDDDPFG